MTFARIEMTDVRRRSFDPARDLCLREVELAAPLADVPALPSQNRYPPAQSTTGNEAYPRPSSSILTTDDSQ